MIQDPENNIKPILIVEDNPLFGSMVCKMIRQQLPLPIIWVKSFAEAREQIKLNGDQFQVALLDLNLPDSEKGEVIDYAVAHQIPSIVFTSRFSPELSEKIWSKGVVDYVLKEGPDSLNHIVKQIRRLQRNHQIKILVADDSALVRDHLIELLKVQGFQVLGAADGQEALDLLNKDKHIRLLMTDYHMPEMDGFQLIRKVRRKFSQNELAIIGLSAQEDTTLSAKFLKYGANDYIAKPFSRDEFYCRVHQNIDSLEQMRQIKESAERDFLTGLYNRRYFFDHWQRVVKKEKSVALAMLDIDFFKTVNDTYGHDAGDLVLKHFATLLKQKVGKDALITRFGGEEFCLLFGSDQADAITRMNDLCRMVRESSTELPDGTSLKVTMSVGLYCGEKQDIEKMIKQADECLYHAKGQGRDQVVTK
jgi:diguanylate cyclase (GGDEF)-like protein